jgi:hypothetical protein
MAERVFKCAIRSTLGDGTEVLMTPHFGCETDGSSADDVLESIQDVVQAATVALLPTTATLTDWTVTQVPLDSTPLPTPQVAYAADGSAGTRSITGDGVSPGICARLITRTGVGSRRSRGAVWLIPVLDVVELAVPSAFVTSSSHYFAKCTDWADAFVGGTYDAGVQPVVYSKTAALANASNVWFHITAYTLPNRQHFLRSRQYPAP